MYQIITDTSALFTPEEGKAMGIEVLPLCVTIGDWEGRDLAMDMEKFYGYIKNGYLPQSSQPLLVRSLMPTKSMQARKSSTLLWLTA